AVWIPRIRRLWNHGPSAVICSSNFSSSIADNWDRVIDGILLLDNRCSVCSLSWRCQKLDRRAISVKCAYVYVLASCFHANCGSSFGQPGVYQRAKIFIMALCAAPQFMERVEHRPRHLDCSPYPLRCTSALFHLNFFHLAALVQNYCVKKLWMLHWEQ